MRTGYATSTHMVCSVLHLHSVLVMCNPHHGAIYNISKPCHHYWRHVTVENHGLSLDWVLAERGGTAGPRLRESLFFVT